MADSYDNTEHPETPNLPKARGRLVFIISAVVALAAGVAGFFGNIDKSMSGIEGTVAYAQRKCIEAGFCAPGNYYIDAQIRVADPDSAHISKLLRTEIGFPSQLFATYDAQQFTGPTFEGISLELRDGPNGKGEFNSLPVQRYNYGELWKPEVTALGWNFGFPILDVLVAEKGKNIDITDFRLDVLSGAIDQTPYLQMLSDPTKFGKIILINESVHEKVVANLKFSIIYDEENCARFSELKTNKFQFEIGGISISEVHELDLSKELTAAGDDDFAFVHYQYELYSFGEEEAGPPPHGFIDWMLGLPAEDNELPEEPKSVTELVAYGLATVKAGENSYESYFCTQIPMMPFDAEGGGGIEFAGAEMIDLSVEKSPYSEYYDVSYRIDKNEPHFRSAFIFHSKQSARFEIRLSFLSFGKIVYESEPIRLHLFVPQTTADRYQLDLSDSFSTPFSSGQAISPN